MPNDSDSDKDEDRDHDEASPAESVEPDGPVTDDEDAPGTDLAAGGWGSVEPNEPA